MNDALIKWLKSLQSIELPAIPHNVQQLKALLAQSNPSLEEIDKILERDMGLALRLMRDINQIRFNAKKDEVESLSRARLFAGTDQLNRLPRDMPMIDQLEPKAMLNYLTIAKRYYHAAWQARQWAALRQDPDPSAIYFATLLHAVGELLLWVKVPQKMLKIQRNIAVNQMAAEEAQYIELGFLISELSKELSKIWHLPQLFRHSLYPESAGDNRIFTILLAIELAHQSDLDWYSPATRNTIERVAHLLLLTTDQTTGLIHRLAVHAAQESSYILLPHAAARLLYPAYPLEEERRVVGLASPSAALKGESGVQSKGEPSPSPRSKKAIEPKTHLICLAPQRPLLIRNLKKLTQNRGELLLKEIVQHTMLALHDGLGLNRVIFAVLTQHNTIKARSIVGSEDVDFNRFMVEIDANLLFKQLIRKPTLLRVDDHNRAQMEPKLSKAFWSHIQVNSFYIASIWVQGKLLGLFYADRATTHCQLDDRSFNLFKKVCHEATAALERGYRSSE